MSEPNQPAPVASKSPEWPEWTEADREALFASVVWFREQQYSGALVKYAGMHVAFVGQQIVDADRDKEALLQRIGAMGNAYPRNRLLVLDVPGPDEPILIPTGFLGSDGKV